MFTISTLEPTDLHEDPTIVNLTFPTYVPLITALEKNKHVLAFKATMEKNVVGLIVGEIDPQGKGCVRSLFTMPLVRGMGIGTALLARLEQAFYLRNCIWLNIKYQNNKPTTAYLEKILAKRQWSDARLNSRFFKIRRDVAATMPWMKRFFATPPYTIFQWHDLPQAERDYLQNEADWYPDVLSPFKSEANIDYTSSIGLRYHDEIIGWAITHRVQPDTVCLSSLFVRDSFAGGRGGILLIAECSRQMAASDVTYGMWMIYNVNETVTRFVQRNCGPYLLKTQETLLRTNLLTEHPPISQNDFENSFQMEGSSCVTYSVL